MSHRSNIFQFWWVGQIESDVSILSSGKMSRCLSTSVLLKFCSQKRKENLKKVKQIKVKVKWAPVSAPVYFSSFVHRKESKMSQSRTFHPIWANWSTFPSFWTAASQKMQELYQDSPQCQDLYQDSPRCLVKVWASHF